MKYWLDPSSCTEQQHGPSAKIFVSAWGHPIGKFLRGSMELYIARTTEESDTTMNYRLYMKMWTFFCGEGAPQQMLRTHRSLKAYCANPVMKMSSILPSCTSNGAPVEWNWQGKTDNSEKNMSQCHFVHHKSHMDLTWDRTGASVVRGRRLTAWAMARPRCGHCHPHKSEKTNLD
jgi:hypothetical protein